MNKDEAIKTALYALENDPASLNAINNAKCFLRQALEQPEQASVPDGWKLVPIEPTDAMLSVPVNIDLRECVTPGGVTGLDAVGLFRAWEAMITAAPAPPSKPWVSLTDEEIFDVIRSLCADNETAEMLIDISMDEYRAIEAKLKEKNK